MKETKLSEEFQNVITENNGLNRYLSGLIIGRKATPRSNLYNLKSVERLSADDVLSIWKLHLDKLQSGSPFEENVYHFDLSQLEKWGPQGEVKPIEELLDEIVLPSFTDDTQPAAFKSENWQRAKRDVVKFLHNSGCIGLSPVSYENVIDDMRARDTLESNSGWPLFTRRNKPEVIKQSIHAAENGQWETYPAIALFRNYNRKTRLVWMFPMSANMKEGSFFQPLQQRLMNTSYYIAKRFLSPWIGFEEVRKVITRAYGNGFQLAASDFSSTDIHFKLSASLEVYDVLKECFQPRFREDLKKSIYHMHTISLITGPDSMIIGEHGVSSGSNWTNFIETIFDWILARFTSFQTSVVFGESNLYDGLYAIGDDMSWYTNQYSQDFTKILSQIGRSVGQEIKAEKTMNEIGKVKSLQRLFQQGYNRSDGQIRAVYSTIRALKSLVYPEKFHNPKLWSKDMEAVRAFMILENCVDHPLFDDFCKFVSAGDPNLRIVAKRPRSWLSQILRIAKLIPGLNPTYNQEKRSQSLSDFKSVQLIASL